MMLLADAFMGVEVGQMASLGVQIIALYAFLKKFDGMREDVAKRAAELVRSSAQEKKDGALPQPLTIQAAEEFVKRGDFHVHARLNREAHEKIERETKDAVEKLAESHNDLGREVSGLRSTVEVNGNLLIEMSRKIDRILERKA